MRQFGLIGFPLVHSFSKKYFTEKFEQLHLDAAYELYELQRIGDLSELLQQNEFSGLNVTIPYKEEVIPFLDELDDTARGIGAVNVIKFIRDGETIRLKGYNSDAIGFENSLKPLLKSHHRKALILGTGGASKAIRYVLSTLGIETLFVSRSSGDGKITYADLTEDILSEYLLIVNASPVGTFPHSNECPDIPYDFINENHLLYDVVYNPAETLFMKKGREHGAVVLNGEAMLIGQAEAAWEIWNR